MPLLSPTLTKVIKRGVLAAIVGFGLLQIAPAKRFGIPTEDIGTNPPERFAFDAPPEVERDHAAGLLRLPHQRDALAALRARSRPARG